MTQSRLTVYSDHDPAHIVTNTQNHAEIAKTLAGIGVRFEQWDASIPLEAQADDNIVMQAYEKDISRLKAEEGYQSVDVLRMSPDHPQKTALRAKFLSEHTHSEDEVRFFVEGAGLFYLRAGGHVYMTLCTRGDLISVPAHTPHWFDMGPEPFLTCIRLFTTPEGWVADYTGDDIAAQFPKFERQAA